MFDWVRDLFGNTKSKSIPAEPLKAYPSVADAEQARAGGYGYGDPQAAYMEGTAGNVIGKFYQGKKVDPFVPAIPKAGPLTKVWDNPQANLTGQAGISSGLLKDQQDAHTRASLASNYVPIAALGLEGRNTTANMSGVKGMSALGAYMPSKDKIYFDNTDPSSLLHEGTHRGIEMLRNRPEVPSDVRKRLTEGGGEESFVRQLMMDYAGDPEQLPQDIMQKRVARTIPMPQKDIAALNVLVAKMMQERRPRGPR
jgi:hypothetical protein